MSLSMIKQVAGSEAGAAWGMVGRTAGAALAGGMAGGVANSMTGGSFWGGAAAGAMSGGALMGVGRLAGSGRMTRHILRPMTAALKKYGTQYGSEATGRGMARSFAGGARQVGHMLTNTANRRAVFGSGAMLGGAMFGGGRNRRRGFNAQRGSRIGHA